jgi:hypothetical protein
MTVAELERDLRRFKPSAEIRLAPDFDILSIYGDAPLNVPESTSDIVWIDIEEHEE